ncbi:MAG: TrkH family potassium uptake protein [Nitrospinae bacterium]|nr:TrkH family potassium uptake protein [Nitrospinota bacterium]
MGPETGKAGPAPGASLFFNPALYLAVGWLLIALAVALLAPLGVALGYDSHGPHGGSSETRAFLVTQLASLLCGGALILRYRGKQEKHITLADGFLIVAVAWLAVGLFSALPYLLSGAMDSPVDAYFESISGLTTTGASVVADLDAMPRGVMFWRCMTQWLGGLGILVLFVAILPALGEGGHNLFRAEISGGASFEKITPRVKSVARAMWLMYLLMSVAQAALLMTCGLSWYDAATHTFTTLSSGGFSPYPQSAGAMPLSAQWVVIVFMVAAGANFTLHYRAAREFKFRAYIESPEFRAYALILLVSGAALSVNGAWMEGQGAVRAVTDGFFQVISMMTTTGLATADFALWSPFAQALLVALMFVGGCSGSTAGSMKIFRHMFIVKAVVTELRRMANPRQVIVTKLRGEVIRQETLTNAFIFGVLFVALFAAGGLFLTMLGVDVVTAFSASIACLSNAGPGLGFVGPMGSFADIPAMGKAALILQMLMGRLELFGVFVFFIAIMRRR